MLMISIMFLLLLMVSQKITQEKKMQFLGALVMMMFFYMKELPLEESFRYFTFLVNYDSLSLSLIILSIYLTILMIFASHLLIKMKFNFVEYQGLMILLMIVLVISFSTSNFLSFYFFFEVSLLPTLMIIMGWGYQPERLQAGVYFMLYTLLASLPLLMNFYLLYTMYGSLWMFSFNYGVTVELSLIFNSSNFLIMFYGLLFILAFLVKMPMFMFHLWLPKAHVEAPVAGSMILAGVLLKLGGYGLCRVFLMFYFIINWVSCYIIGLSIMGMVLVGFNCCRLNDMKALVAYSSVAHMGLVLGGLFSFYFWGMAGGLMLMVSHGLVSSGLFCMVNIFYERWGSRSLFLNKGLLTLFPIFCLLIFLLCCFNIAAPPSINLLSEIFLMISVLGFEKMMMLLFPLGSFLGAVFTFYMFSYSQHGKPHFIGWGFSDSIYIEYHTVGLHLFPVILLIMNSSLFLVYL